MMRMASSGAACGASAGQSCNAFSKSTELDSSAAVLVSRDGGARLRWRWPDQGDIGAHLSERQRRGNPRRAGADHGDVAGRRIARTLSTCFVHSRPQFLADPIVQTLALAGYVSDRPQSKAVST